MPLPQEMSSDFARGSGNNNSSSGGSSSSLVWQQYVDITFLVANVVILLGTSMVGMGANIFVTWAVYHQKTLRTWNNALLVNLAVVDFLRCAVDCPIILVIALTVHLRGRADAAICDLQMASFSFSCCIQLVTLACISAERYQAIAHPFKIAERKRRIIFFIPLTWIFAIVVAAVCVTFVRDSPVYVKCHGSRFKSTYKDTFGLYVLIPLWTACFALIIGFYSSIFAIVTAHSRKIYDKGVNLPPKEEKKEEKKEEEMPAGQTDKKQMTVESVARVEKVEHSKSKVSIMEPTGAPQKPTETVSVLQVPIHNEKVAVPTKETDKPSDEKLLKQPKPTPKDIKGDCGGCKTPTKGRVVEAGSSETEKKTPLVAHPVIQVQQQLSNGDTEAHPGTDKVPGKKGQDKIQIKESKPPAPVPVAPKGPSLPVKEHRGQGDLLIDLEQGKVKDQVVPMVVGLAAVNDQVVGLPSVNNEVVPMVVGLPGVNNEVVPMVVGLPGVNDEVVPMTVGLPGTNDETVAMVVGLPAADTADNQDLCMVSVVRRPAPAATAAAADEAVTGAVCMMPSKATGNKKKESKLAKRSGYIILTFLLFWLPLITTILVNVLVSHRSDAQVSVCGQCVGPG